jgi:glycerate kinase
MNMKFVIAPDSFKESMDANTAAHSIQKGLRAVYPDASYCLFPMADGGEGTLKAVHHYSPDGKIINASVHGPLNSLVQSEILYIPSKSEIFIEMAEASGIMLIDKNHRNPLKTSTYGVGELVKIALTYHPKRLVIGIGGSVTNDGGAGFLQALGLSFLDANRNPIQIGGQYLKDIEFVESTQIFELFNNIDVIVLSDVKNHLLGPEGATFTYGTQKGGTKEILNQLETGMSHFANIMETTFSKNCRNLPGSGAAGGLGFALHFLPNVKFLSGIDYISSLSKIEEDIKNCDAVFIGEGSLDKQSLQGKVPIGIARIAKKHHKTVVALVGKLECRIDEVSLHGIDYVFTINDDAENLNQLLKDGPKNIELTAKKVAKTLRERGIL